MSVSPTLSAKLAAATRAAQAEVAESLPFADRQDFEDAARGKIADVPAGGVHTADGRSGT